mgnify:FL=1
MHKTTYIILFGLCGLLPVDAQYRTKAIDSGIRTLRVRYAEQSGVQRPFLVLQDGVVDGTDPQNTLEISFDEMSHDVRFYTYTLLHLNADWTESSLSSSEYVSGFTTQDVSDYAHSLNTRRDYTHYRFLFPNEDMQIRASGNYALKIYEDGNPDKVAAFVCFSVVEPLAGITAEIRSNTSIELSGRYQQVDIDINTSALDLRDPNEIKTVVRQNGRIDNQAIPNAPTYVEPNRLRYINQRELIFEGGNEYRHFDAYSVYFSGTGIDRIHFDNRDYHAFLFADALRGTGAEYSGGVVTDKCGTPYMHEYDADGQYLINAERTTDTDTEAEYMWVHWTLPARNPWFDGSVYVGGDLFFNHLGADNRMSYDNENRCYYLTRLVKQGGYDYQYWFVNKGGTGATLQRTEGSHWQSENEYTIYVYYRPFGGRYDQLVGYQILRSTE